MDAVVLPDGIIAQWFDFVRSIKGSEAVLQRMEADYAKWACETTRSYANLVYLMNLVRKSDEQLLARQSGEGSSTDDSSTEEMVDEEEQHVLIMMMIMKTKKNIRKKAKLMNFITVKHPLKKSSRHQFHQKHFRKKNTRRRWKKKKKKFRTSNNKLEPSIWRRRWPVLNNWCSTCSRK